jgi:hypothetical protein
LEVEGTGPSRSGIVAGASASGGGRAHQMAVVSMAAWEREQRARLRREGLESEGESEGEGVRRRTLRCRLPAFHSGLFAVGSCRSMPRRCKHADAAAVTCRSGIGCMYVAARQDQDRVGVGVRTRRRMRTRTGTRMRCGCGCGCGCGSMAGGRQCKRRLRMGGEARQGCNGLLATAPSVARG